MRQPLVFTRERLGAAWAALENSPKNWPIRFEGGTFEYRFFRDLCRDAERWLRRTGKPFWVM